MRLVARAEHTGAILLVSEGGQCERRNLPGKGFPGGVNVLYGTSTGLSGAGSQLWNQDSPGILSTAKKDEQFGDALVPARA